MLWQGEYQGVNRLWLRWYDQDHYWLPTPAERAQKADERAQQQAQRAEPLAAHLRALGIDPE